MPSSCTHPECEADHRGDDERGGVEAEPREVYTDLVPEVVVDRVWSHNKTTLKNLKINPMQYVLNAK